MNDTTSQPIELSSDLTERPTRVRFGVLAFMCTLGVILYLDRICWGVAKIPIHDQLGISDWHLSWIDAAFMIPYGLFEMPIGRWGDRHGARGVITRIGI